MAEHPIDVLAILDSEIAASHPLSAERLTEVRDAVAEMIEAGDKLGAWVSAAMEAPDACAEFKADAQAFLTAVFRLRGTE